MSREVLWTPQPLPVPGDKLVKELIRRDFRHMDPTIVEDCVQKMEASEEKYGSPLMTKNGRVATLDAYTDLIDTLNYLVQEREEAEDINDKVYIDMDIGRLFRVANNLRYRLEEKGILEP